MKAEKKSIIKKSESKTIQIQERVVQGVWEWDFLVSLSFTHIHVIFLLYAVPFFYPLPACWRRRRRRTFKAHQKIPHTRQRHGEKSFNSNQMKYGKHSVRLILIQFTTGAILLPFGGKFFCFTFLFACALPRVESFFLFLIFTCMKWKGKNWKTFFLEPRVFYERALQFIKLSKKKPTRYISLKR